MGVSRQWVYQIFRKRPISQASKIADVFGMNPDFLLTTEIETEEEAY